MRAWSNELVAALQQHLDRTAIVQERRPRGRVLELDVRQPAAVRRRAITLAVAQSEWRGRSSGCAICAIETPTAVGLCCEVGDLARFARARHPASFLRLVHSENSNGRRRRLGAITKTGSRHTQRLLVEAAWHYRPPPRLGRELQQRHAEQPAAAVAIGWSAQQRLHRTWRRMQRRGKRRPLIAVAVARELADFCWAIARIE